MTSYPISDLELDEAVTLEIESTEHILENEEVNSNIVDEGKIQERIVTSGTDVAITFFNDYENNLTDSLTLQSSTTPVLMLVTTYGSNNSTYVGDFFTKLKMLLDAQVGTFNVDDFNIRNFIYDLIRMRENNPLLAPLSIYMYIGGDSDFHTSASLGQNSRLYIYPRDIPQPDKDIILQDMSSQMPSYSEPTNLYHIFVYTNNGQGKFTKVDTPSSYTIVDQAPTSRTNILLVGAIGGILVGGVLAAVLMSNSNKPPRVRR